MKLLYLLALAILLNFSLVSGQIIDETFSEPIPTRPAKIYSIKVLPDNKLLLGGDIAFYKDKRVNNLIILNPDNSLDETFNFPADKKITIRKIEFLSNGDMIILGNIDAGFEIFSDKWSLLHIGTNGEIKAEINTLLNSWSIAIQNDDKILVCSEKITPTGPSNFLYRLNSDFSSDDSFNSIFSANGSVTDVKINNNKIYICGTFTKVNNIVRNKIAVLNINGSVSTSFNPGSGTSDPVNSIAVQPDGKVLIGSSYINNYNGTTFFGMIRINSDGSADTGFSPPPFNSPTSEITIKDSSIFVAAYNQAAKIYLHKLNYNGLPYPGFIPVSLDEYAFSEFVMALKDNDIIFNNSTTVANKYGLSKCDPEGELITTFNPEVSRFGVVSSGYYLNRKMLISGDFMKINNVETYGIAMLDENGEPDEGFVLSKNLGKVNQVQISNDTTIYVSTKKSFLKLDAKANILKDFDYLNLTKLFEILKFIILKDGSIIATDANAIVKIRPDGTQDANFNTGTGIDHTCTVLDFDMQGEKIIFGSDFNFFDGKPVHKLIRINSNGSLDQSFDIGSGPSDVVYITKVLTSGEIIAGGNFWTFDNANVPRRIVKLSKNGKMDNVFLNNQKYSMSQYPGPNTKIEQIDSIIYVKNSSSIYALNLDGSDNTEFHLPFSITSVSDIFAMNDSIKVPGGRKSLGEDKPNMYLFALGSFIKSGNNDPSFIIKLNIDAFSMDAFSISTSRINLAAAANSSSTFNISSNVSWELSSSHDWISVSELSGFDNATITVTATANTSENQRNATLTITGAGVPARIVDVVQASALPEITDSDVKIWLVPVYDKINITYPGNDKPGFSIYSSTGVHIYSSNINSANTEVDVSDFTSGVYYIIIFPSNRKVITRKIIKVK